MTLRPYFSLKVSYQKCRQDRHATESREGEWVPGAGWFAWATRTPEVPAANQIDKLRAELRHEFNAAVQHAYLGPRYTWVYYACSRLSQEDETCITHVYPCKPMCTCEILTSATGAALPNQSAIHMRIALVLQSYLLSILHTHHLKSSSVPPSIFQCSR